MRVDGNDDGDEDDDDDPDDYGDYVDTSNYINDPPYSRRPRPANWDNLNSSALRIPPNAIIPHPNPVLTPEWCTSADPKPLGAPTCLCNNKCDMCGNDWNDECSPCGRVRIFSHSAVRWGNLSFRRCSNDQCPSFKLVGGQYYGITIISKRPTSRAQLIVDSVVDAVETTLLVEISKQIYTTALTFDEFHKTMISRYTDREYPDACLISKSNFIRGLYRCIEHLILPYLPRENLLCDKHGSIPNEFVMDGTSLVYLVDQTARNNFVHRRTSYQ